MKDYPVNQRSIGYILADKAQTVGNLPWIKWNNSEISYLELNNITNSCANSLISLGIRHGDHVAIMLANCPDFLYLIWALGKIGAVGVPLNTAAKGELLRYFIDQSDSKWLVVDEEYCSRIADISSQLPKLRGIVIRGEVTTIDFSNHLTRVDFAELKRGANSSAITQHIHSSDIHLIMYTSGTTGPSKGVMSPHSQGHAVGRSVAQGYGYDSNDVLYVSLPLFHVNALWYSVYAALWANACVALAPRFSASQFWNDICNTGATQFNALGAMTNILWQLPRTSQEIDNKLRLAMLVPAPKAIYTEFQERYDVTITSVYAMTENFAVTLLKPQDDPSKIGSAGKPGDDVQIKILGDNGNLLPANQTGEICIKAVDPSYMMKGYYKMPEATAKEFHDGWFHTGDRGYLDNDGYLFFVDRRKEAIRRRGENISAYEVELILSRHPAIHEVAAVPISSEMMEDEVMVYVVCKPGMRIEHAEVVRFANDNMAYFMVPRFVDFVDHLPKTSSEKIEKYKLKANAESQRDKLWDREKENIIIRR